MQETKIKEKALLEMQRNEFFGDQKDWYRDLKEYVNNLELLHSTKSNNDREDCVKKVIEKIENKISEFGS